jgi:hypothetical protein
MAFQANLDPELAPGLDAFKAMGFTGGGIDLANVPAMRAQAEALLRAQIEEAARSQNAPAPRVSTEDRRVPGPAGAADVADRDARTFRYANLERRGRVGVRGQSSRCEADLCS